MPKSSDQTFSPNLAMDAAIKELLAQSSEASQRRMKKAILHAGKAALKHQDENTDAGARHIFREFIPACVLNRCSYRLEYNWPIGGKTPDWLDLTSGLLIDSYTYERGGNPHSMIASNQQLHPSVRHTAALFRPILFAL